MFNAPENRKPGFRLALFGVILALGVIVLGAYTRLVDAGLGCPDWPGCYGHLLWPQGDAEIAAANAAWPDMPVEMDKTWPEMVHRYFAAGLGLVAVVLAALAWRHRGPGQPLRLPLFLLGFVILQGLFGMWTVTLKLWPQVVTAHLLGGFTTICLFWLLVLRLDNRPWSLEPALPGRFFTPAAVGLAVLIAQITLGGWTTSNYAAVACPDLPTCQGRWLPPMDIAAGFNIFQSVGPNYLGGVMTNEARVAIHMSHRIGAIITLLYLGWLGIALLRGESEPLKNIDRAVGLLLVLQFCLGLGNILFHFPLSMTVSHNAVGALLLLAVVTLVYRLYTARSAA